MGKTLVELSTGISVYGEYELVDGDMTKQVQVTSFDIEQGWFDARSNGNVERYFMKDYGITPKIDSPKWWPENNGKRMFLLK